MAGSGVKMLRRGVRGPAPKGGGRWGKRLLRLRCRYAASLGRWPRRGEMVVWVCGGDVLSPRTYGYYESGHREPPAWLQVRVAERERELR